MTARIATTTPDTDDTRGWADQSYANEEANLAAAIARTVGIRWDTPDASERKPDETIAEAKARWLRGAKAARARQAVMHRRDRDRLAAAEEADRRAAWRALKDVQGVELAKADLLAEALGVTSQEAYTRMALVIKSRGGDVASPYTRPEDSGSGYRTDPLEHGGPCQCHPADETPEEGRLHWYPGGFTPGDPGGTSWQSPADRAASIRRDFAAAMGVGEDLAEWAWAEARHAESAARGMAADGIQVSEGSTVTFRTVGRGPGRHAVHRIGRRERLHDGSLAGAWSEGEAIERSIDPRAVLATSHTAAIPPVPGTPMRAAAR